MKGARRGEEGYTLLELIVAMALLGLVFALLAGGLRFGAAVWEKGGDVATRTAELQTTQRLLRRLLEQIQPHNKPGRGRTVRAAFTGGADELLYVGAPPAHLAAPGPYLIRLGVDGARRDKALTLSWRRLQPDLRDVDDSQPTDSTVLIRGVKDVTFAFFGNKRPRDRPSWHGGWANEQNHPQLIRLSLSYGRNDQRQWPVLIVAPAVQALR